METNHSQPLAVPALPGGATEQELFHEADTLLRSGVHIQLAHPGQRRLAQYLHRHEGPLAEFYHTWHQGARLAHEQEGPERYYYLEPPAGAWQQAGTPYVRELKPAYLLVALLLCKVFRIDLRRPEFASVEELMVLLEREYAEYRDGLFRQFAQVTGKRRSELDDQQVRDLVERALEWFGQVGWLYRPVAGGWQVLPALERIRELYRNEIAAMPDRFKPRP